MRRWLGSLAMRRLRRELADYERPRIGLAPLLGRTSRDGVHVHRALVEVNFFPRPRH